MNSDSENDSLNTEIVFPVENLSMQNDQEQKSNKDDDLMFIKSNSNINTSTGKVSKKNGGDNGKKSKKKQSNNVATLAIQQQPVTKDKHAATDKTSSIVQLEPAVISKQPSKNKQPTKGKEHDLIDIDCFLDEDMLEQKKTEFQQYEQKVKNIDVNTEQYDPHQQQNSNEPYHQNHPDEKFEYKENILLINEFEQMMVRNAQEFCEKLGYKTDDNGKSRLVKVISVFGCTGDFESFQI